MTPCCTQPSSIGYVRCNWIYFWSVVSFFVFFPFGLRPGLLSTGVLLRLRLRVRPEGLSFAARRAERRDIVTDVSVVVKTKPFKCVAQFVQFELQRYLLQMLPLYLMDSH